MKTYCITIEGVTYTVEVDDVGRSPATVRVNGQPVSVEWQGAAAPAQAEPHKRVESDGPTAATAAGGLPAPIAARPVSPASDKGVLAPMPGKILTVRVRLGDRVTYGQELCVLEAMKMEQIIRSPRDGVIDSVNVVPGDSVVNGYIMFTFK